MDEVRTIDLFAKPQRNALGQFVKGNTLSVGNDGKPCLFCAHKDEVLKKVNLYYAWVSGKINGKQRIPWIEQLCDDDYLDITDETLANWTKHAHDPEAHSELIAAISKIFRKQRFWLKVSGLKATNTSFYQFLLERNHGMIPVQREIKSGDKDNPIENKLQIEITEAKRHE